MFGSLRGAKVVELDPILGNVYRAPNPGKELEKAKLTPIFYQNVKDNLGFDLAVVWGVVRLYHKKEDREKFNHQKLWVDFLTNVNI